MKQVIKVTTFFFIAVLAFASCKKEKTGTASPIASNNKTPVANAGFDQTIKLPTDSVELSGSGTDADGSIVRYEWIKICGPLQHSFVNPNAAVTKVKNLVNGVYEFELKVTDDGGLFAKDKVVVTVDAPGSGITYLSLIPVGALSINRTYTAAATSGNKILFAGGENGPGIIVQSRVDIFNTSTQTWSTAELSEARAGIGAVTLGNKILFAGGAKNFNYNDGWFDLSTRVDIYDVSTNIWTTTELPEPINFLWWEGAVAAVGNKAFFCGNRQNTVYIYDLITNSWSTAQLSGYRPNLAATSVGNKILIAGGGSNKVDVYDASTNTWSIDLLNQATRSNITATSLNSKAFFAGGQFTNKVDIYDDATRRWSLGTLSRSSGGLSTVLCGGAASLGQRVLFFGSNLVDIYDSSLNTWSIRGVAESFCDGSAIIAAGGNVFITKGNVIWRVQL